jgi:NitT/TauT family transport system ATP-binding protein
MSDGSQPVVAMSDVTKVFGKGEANQVTALKDINFEAQAGEFISLIGPSGCGKSTMLRLVGDLIPPSTGAITINGKNAHQARIDRDYGMVFQAPVLYDWRSVSANVELPLELMGYGRQERSARAKEMLELVELGEFGRHYPWQLSGGMQQRVSIARALAFKPALLLMDEPFGALDEMTRERMNMELHSIWQRTAITVIFVTHSILEAVFLSTRVIVMSARPGQIAEEITIDLPHPRSIETREDPRFFEYATQVREALRKHEAGI